jgi:putative tricarboxylic transport membrane protein
VQKANIIGALILVTISLIFTIEAIKMPIFEGASPGPGFVPLGIGLLILILSIILLFQSLIMDPLKGKTPFMGKKHGLRDILIITFSLFAYSGCILLLGYPLSTLLFLFFLLKGVGKYSNRFSLGVSAIVTMALYGIFQYWLEMAFPEGIFPIL